MARHIHLCLDLDTGDITHLALPEEGDGGTPAFSDFRRNIPLVGLKNGSNTVFTTPDKFVRSPFEEVVYYNGVLQEEGAGNDYIVSESGGAGTGYDTITFSIAPYSWEKLTIDYIIKA
jgi:hypothetical protein